MASASSPVSDQGRFVSIKSNFGGHRSLGTESGQTNLTLVTFGYLSLED